jgi:membrane protein
MNIKQIEELAKNTFSSWLADYAQSMGAALAYYTLFSIAPLLLIVISIAGILFGQAAARGEIFDQLQGLMGTEGAYALQGLLASVSKPGQGIAGTIVGIILTLLGATTVLNELQNSLDRIWRAPERVKSSGLWNLLRSRLPAFGMVLGIGFLLMVSLVFHAVMAALEKWMKPVFGQWALLANAVNLGITFALTIAVFAMIYKLMPRVSIRWHDVWIGATVTAVLFTVGKYLIGIYIGRSGITSGFGAAGSLVVFLVWVYYSAQIFLMGAEFTWVYTRTFGSRKGELGTDKAPAGQKTEQQAQQQVQ